jgi:signal transduction histidine kinase
MDRRRAGTPAALRTLTKSAGPVRPRPVLARLASLVLRPTAARLGPGLLVAASLIGAESLVVLLLKHVGPGNLFGVIFLIGVLVVSTRWGWGLAAITAVSSGLAFDYFANSPGESMPARAENWAAIAILLVVALVANTLAALARACSAEADRRRREAEASRDRLGVLMVQQAALRRVATLVARGVSPCEVFSAVVRELPHCLGVSRSALVRYEPAGATVIVASLGQPGLTKTQDSQRFSLAHIRTPDIGNEVGAPIIVDGRLWGAATVGWSRPEPLPPDTGARVAEFADLAATAIANAETRRELTASRARIVAAADEARRRFERDLHDGAQQRLVSLELELRNAEASLPPEMHPIKKQVSTVAGGLAGVLEDLQGISRGIHPAMLSKAGLGPALKTLARRSAVPVELDLCLSRRLPESAEVGAYYVVAEALTNAAKHAQASVVNVGIRAERANLDLAIRDDGIGGADACKGSGLIGLRDRVETLGGAMTISSPHGHGTTLLVRIPLLECGDRRRCTPGFRNR